MGLRLCIWLPCSIAGGVRLYRRIKQRHLQWLRLRGLRPRELPKQRFPLRARLWQHSGLYRMELKMQPIDQSGDNGYADYNAPDWSTDHKTHVPLSDFFNLSTPRQFTSINTTYNAQFFQDYYHNHPGYTPTGPDGGPDD